MKKDFIKKTFLQGLITVLPLAVTAYVLYWTVASLESALSSAISYLGGGRYYVPGLGLLVVLVFLFGIGLLSSVWLGRKIVELGEQLLEKVPLVKTIYGSMKDMFSYFNVSNDNELNRPALVKHPDLKMHILGFITQADTSKLSNVLPQKSDIEQNSGDDKVYDDLIAVYLPMSYQIGGFTILVSKSDVTPLDLTIEEAMKFVITAGVSGKR